MISSELVSESVSFLTELPIPDEEEEMFGQVAMDVAADASDLEGEEVMVQEECTVTSPLPSQNRKGMRLQFDVTLDRFETHKCLFIKM